MLGKDSILMKKLTLAVLIITLSIGTLAACGQEEPEAAAEPAEEVTEEVAEETIEDRPFDSTSYETGEWTSTTGKTEQQLKVQEAKPYVTPEGKVQIVDPRPNTYQIEKANDAASGKNSDAVGQCSSPKDTQNVKTTNAFSKKLYAASDGGYYMYWYVVDSDSTHVDEQKKLGETLAGRACKHTTDGKGGWKVTGWEFQGFFSEGSIYKQTLQATDGLGIPIKW